MGRKMKTMDGNHAAAHASYAFTDVAAIYPITPSSVMAEATDEWATQGRTNIFGQTVQVTEMQSEAGAAGTVHGSLAAGALTTTYTASQGLLLMIPNLYKIAGEQLPGVFNVSARALASHALSIFGDHSDVYACRQTGCAMLCESSVQEVMDLTPVAHLSAIKGKIPFINFFDGFRTSHEIQKIETWDYEDLKDMADMDAIDAFRKHALNPNHPCQRGSAQNPDIFFQAREACNPFYDAMPAIVQEYMDKVNEKIGTNYKLFNYHGAEDAEHVIIAMGSVCDTIDETVDYLLAAGRKVGVVKVRLYRPFCAEALINAIPESVKQITVLDRTKEPGALGEPLYLDVVASLKGTKFDAVPVFTGRYGLGSKDTTPAQIVAVYDNTEKQKFTIGIVDDVTFTSLEVGAPVSVTSPDVKECLFFGLGADGTVGANKNSIKIIGDKTDLYAQGYFAYDSKKSGGVTRSHLRFGKSPIKASYLISNPSFVACSVPAYLHLYDMTSGIRKGGSFLVNGVWATPEEAIADIPAKVKKDLAKNGARLFIINATALAEEIGLGQRTNTIMQAAFFKLADIIPFAEAQQYMKDYAKKSYAKKGDDIVQMNYSAIDKGAEGLVEIPVDPAWADLEVECACEGHEHENCCCGSCSHEMTKTEKFVERIAKPVNAIKGYDLPVSAFDGYEDGTFENGTSAFEKRGIAVHVPVWKAENCIQCNQCSYVCPHAVLRPFLMTAEEKAASPVELTTVKPIGKGLEGFEYRMQVSALDCTGCGSCANVCPAKEKALVMMPIATSLEAGEDKKAAYLFNNVEYRSNLMSKDTVKGSQFSQPLFEFHGACPGCGETPYLKAITQLFGERMMIANATGCSSIYSGSAPATPYTTNKDGHGPSWGSSLFEDNAEFGYGMKLAQNYNEAHMIQVMEEAKDACEPELKEIIEKYLSVKGQRSEEKAIVPELLKLVEASSNEAIKEVLDNKGNLVSKSQWIVGGDGWAYDIGYGGLDHVIANNENVNILVLDTEVYSNTGGQSSKSSQAGSIAKFTAGGKTGAKKDLAQIAMAYGHVYVAQVAMGANPAQTIKALKEAESYDGPSLIIAYAPCQAHGIKGGLANHQAEQKRAIDCGYFNLLRYDPRLEEEGKNPLQLDSKTPNFEGFKDYLLGENRFSQLLKVNPEHAEQLMAKCQADAQKRRARLEKMAQ